MEFTVDVEYTVEKQAPGHDRAVLSDERPTSSYGIPVLVWRGEPHGIADLPPDTKIKIVWKKARTGLVWSLIQRAINAGYPIEIDPICVPRQ